MEWGKPLHFNVRHPNKMIQIPTGQRWNWPLSDTVFQLVVQFSRTGPKRQAFKREIHHLKVVERRVVQHQKQTQQWVQHQESGINLNCYFCSGSKLPLWLFILSLYHTVHQKSDKTASFALLFLPSVYIQNCMKHSARTETVLMRSELRSHYPFVSHSSQN